MVVRYNRGNINYSPVIIPNKIKTYKKRLTQKLFSVKSNTNRLTRKNHNFLKSLGFKVLI